MKASHVIATFIFSAITSVSSVLAATPHNMIGCLAKGATEGSFVLTHVEGGVPLVAIAESSAELAPHVGHKVEITGTTVTGKDAKVHTMNVTAMKHLDTACP